MPVAIAGGEIPEDQLGITLAHEHIVVTSPEVWQSWPAMLGPYDDLVAVAVSQLRTLRERHGVTTMVDPTTPDLGRNVSFLEAVASGSGVALVLATGCWIRPPQAFLERGVDALADHFTAEIIDGLPGSTTSRAGVIKVGCREGVSAAELTVLRAAATAHLRTGVPIIVHGDGPSRSHLLVAAALESFGVAPEAVCLGHIHDCADTDYLIEMARRGYWLGLDRFPGRFRFGPTPAARIDALARLLDEGFGDRLCVSHDWSVRTTLLSDADEVTYRTAYNPDGFGYCFDRLVPALAARGHRSALDDLFVKNPRAFLTPRAGREARQR